MHTRKQMKADARKALKQHYFLFLLLCLAVALCGSVEYFTSVYLEYAHNGTRWWDYTGYFLNLNGRICAEGLLVFGIGGMAIIYVLAPFLDGLFRRLPSRVLMAAGLVLLLLFAADQFYSAGHPNTGKGITDYEAGILAGEVMRG